MWVLSLELAAALEIRNRLSRFSAHTGDEGTVCTVWDKMQMSSSVSSP